MGIYPCADAQYSLQAALRAEDLEGEGDGEYGGTSGRAFLGSTRAGSAMGRTSRSAVSAGPRATSFMLSAVTTLRHLRVQSCV